LRVKVKDEEIEILESFRQAGEIHTIPLLLDLDQLNKPLFKSTETSCTTVIQQENIHLGDKTLDRMF